MGSFLFISDSPATSFTSPRLSSLVSSTASQTSPRFPSLVSLTVSQKSPRSPSLVQPTTLSKTTRTPSLVSLAVLHNFNCSQSLVSPAPVFLHDPTTAPQNPPRLHVLVSHTSSTSSQPSPVSLSPHLSSTIFTVHPNPPLPHNSQSTNDLSRAPLHPSHTSFAVVASLALPFCSYWCTVFPTSLAPPCPFFIYFPSPD